MAVTTFTTTPAEDNRLQAWAAIAPGGPGVKSAIITLIRQQLAQFELQQNTQTFQQGYTPINPT